MRLRVTPKRGTAAFLDQWELMRSEANEAIAALHRAAELVGDLECGGPFVAAQLTEYAGLIAKALE